jgi:hypothetical protein
MDEILDYREDYPQAWSQANPPPCGIAGGVDVISEPVPPASAT